MAIPNCQHIVADLAAQYPQEWQQAHRGGPQTEAFIRRLAWVLHSTVDAGFGLLGQYGDPNRIADDAIMYLGEGPGIDKGTGRPQSGFDVIGGAGGPDPRPVWQDISGSGAAIWVQPQPVGGRVDGGTPPPPPPPPPAVDLTPVLDAIKALDAKLSNWIALVSADVSEIKADADAAAAESFNAATRASEIKTQLGDVVTLIKGQSGVTVVAYEGRFLGQRFTLTPKG